MIDADDYKDEKMQRVVTCYTINTKCFELTRMKAHLAGIRRTNSFLCSSNPVNQTYNTNTFNPPPFRLIAARNCRHCRLARVAVLVA